MTRTRTASVALVCALSCAVLGACDSSPTRTAPSPSASPSPVGVSRVDLIGKWSVTNVYPTEGIAALRTLNNPYIEFESDGTVNGFDSVNSFSGKVDVVGNQLRISETITSLVGLTPSAPTVMRETQSAFSTLTSGKPVRIQIVGRTMKLDCGSLSLTAIRR